MEVFDRINKELSGKKAKAFVTIVDENNSHVKISIDVKIIEYVKNQKNCVKASVLNQSGNCPDIIVNIDHVVVLND